MRISQASDYALRVLMLLAQTDDPLRVGEISERLAVSNSHVMKIVAKLAGLGLVETQRGRGGGVRLAVSPDEIQLGNVVRSFEPDFAVVECLQTAGAGCVYLPRCALKPAMLAATDAFLACLDQYTLARIVRGSQVPRRVERATRPSTARRAGRRDPG